MLRGPVNPYTSALPMLSWQTQARAQKHNTRRNSTGRLIALHKMKLTARAQGCCTVSSSLEEYGDRKQLGCLFISTLGELQRGTKQNMNDGHVTKGLPESFHDNCPQRMDLHSGRYQPQKPFDIIYTARCHGQAGARFMKDTSLISISYVIVKLFFVLNKII